MAKSSNKQHLLRVAALADIHYGRTSQGALSSLFAGISAAADVLLIAGDLTDYGLAEEAHVLAKDLAANVKIPVIAVLGNHDFESGQASEVSSILSDAGLIMLDGGHFEVDGVGIAGVKGFGGGFGRQMLTPWGEGVIKSFVTEAVDETLKLETALSKMSSPCRIVLLHYSPVRATVEGENPEIYPFTGCSRLEEPLNRYKVFAAFHGHAHKGNPEGQTQTGVAVYNVSLPVLQKAFPDRAPYRLIEVPVDVDIET